MPQLRGNEPILGLREGLPEGLRGREGWRFVLSCGARWVEESWVLGLL
jgi:hypothetical protein